jgi:hypothetical protein
MPLASLLEFFQDSLLFSQTFTGKGGGRRNGCMVNCDANEAAANAAEAYLAGECLTTVLLLRLVSSSIYVAEDAWQVLTRQQVLDANKQQQCYVRDHSNNNFPGHSDID